MLNERKKVSNKVDTESRPVKSSDRGGEGTLNTSRRTGAATAQTFNETKPQAILRYSSRERRKEIHVNTQVKRQSHPGRDNKSTERKSEPSGD